MTDKERYNKYIKEECINCKNKHSDLCNIKIIKQESEIVTMCCYYDPIIERRKKKPSSWQKW